MNRLRVGFSIADQSLRRSKSIGILNVSLGLLGELVKQPEIGEVVVFGNSSLAPIPNATLQTHDSVATRRWARLWWDQFGVYRAAKSSGCDWLFLPKGFASFVGKPPVKMAAYVHDAMHDFYRSHYGGGFSPFENFYFPRAFEAVLRHATVIFTNSEFTAQEARRMANKLGTEPPRIVVAGIGFDPVKLREPKQDLITMLVSKWPHKMTGRAVEWLARWQSKTQYGGQVQLVGDLPPGVALPPLSNWRLISRLGGEDFETILQRSRAVVYFSEYEGFGMPPIEAALRQAAPVYSRIPAMMETAGGLGFPFDNDSSESFDAALNGALACQAARIKQWAEILSKRHAWPAVARRVAVALAQPPR